MPAMLYYVLARVRSFHGSYCSSVDDEVAALRLQSQLRSVMAYGRRSEFRIQKSISYLVVYRPFRFDLS